jgi:hypothetical protein
MLLTGLRFVCFLDPWSRVVPAVTVAGRVLRQVVCFLSGGVSLMVISSFQTTNFTCYLIEVYPTAVVNNSLSKKYFSRYTFKVTSRQRLYVAFFLLAIRREPILTSAEGDRQ